MFRTSRTVAIALVVFGAACGRDSSKAADSSLNTDLSLAAQQRGTLDSLTAAERGNALSASGAVAAPRTVSTSNGTVARTTRRRTTSSGSNSSGSSSSGSTTTASGTETVKHTKRDAAIGAAAGAIIGATTSRDKVKGGVIGAAVGGILGGVIGNNVDIKKKKKP